MPYKNNHSSNCLGVIAFMLLIVYITNHIINPDFLKNEKFTNTVTPIILVLFIFISVFINCYSRLSGDEDSEEDQSLV